MPSKIDRIDPKRLVGNPRASLSSWLKYQDIVISAFNHHPAPYVYTPQNRSPNTICSQLRDAVRGCLAFDYPCTISKSDLLRWYSEVVFKHDTQAVYIGSPERIIESLAGTGITPNASDTTFRFPELTFEEISAFTLLLSTGRLKGPVHINTPPDITLLPDRPNVERLNREDGSLILL